jgi:hypothetical protein
MTAPAGLYCFDDNAPRNTDAGGPPLVEGGLPDGGLTPVDRPPPAERPALDAAVATVRDRYVGNWTFGANAVELTDCGPGTTPVQRSLQGAPMTIFAGDLRPGGGPADLTAMDICELYLRLDSSGTLLLGADQAGCVSVDTIPEGTFRSTYAAYEFSFFTGNGQTGTLTLADYDVLWEELDGNGNVIGAIVCRQTVSNATLAKAVAVK